MNEAMKNITHLVWRIPWRKSIFVMWYSICTIEWWLEVSQWNFPNYFPLRVVISVEIWQHIKNMYVWRTSWAKKDCIASFRNRYKIKQYKCFTGYNELHWIHKMHVAQAEFLNNIKERLIQPLFFVFFYFKQSHYFQCHDFLAVAKNLYLYNITLAVV